MSELREKLARHLLMNRSSAPGRPRAVESRQPGDRGNAAGELLRPPPAADGANGIVPRPCAGLSAPLQLGGGDLAAVTAPLIIVFMVLIGLLTEQRTRKALGADVPGCRRISDLVGGLATFAGQQPGPTRTA